ncbi:hypothetical protein BgiBS90_038329 [Biomphalaria glabrata]|nr:hypothetical protein BgiBS90_038329 [Biomphalaria glabrata]
MTNQEGEYLALCPETEVLTAHDIQKGERVAIWPRVTEVLTTTDHGKGDCVAINSTSDEAMNAHDIGKGEYVAIWPVTES